MKQTVFLQACRADYRVMVLHLELGLPLVALIVQDSFWTSSLLIAYKIEKVHHTLKLNHLFFGVSPKQNQQITTQQKNTLLLDRVKFGFIKMNWTQLVCLLKLIDGKATIMIIENPESLVEILLIRIHSDLQKLYPSASLHVTLHRRCCEWHWRCLLLLFFLALI